MNSTTIASSVCKFDLEIEIAASRETVWKLIFEDTNQWWLPDFHVAGPDSVVMFDPIPGGSGLVETTSDGGALLWYSVQMHLPSDFKIYLIGHIAPDWGGPTISSLKLALIEAENGCVLQLSDARHGNIEDSQVKCSLDGWQQLFADGLKKFAEQQAS